MCKKDGNVCVPQLRHAEHKKVNASAEDKDLGIGMDTGTQGNARKHQCMFWLKTPGTEYLRASATSLKDGKG
jgi:hypothetical protein